MDERKLDKTRATEGRDKFFVDEDRMINEGLAGGTVSYKNNSGEIEEARELTEEEPPQHTN